MAVLSTADITLDEIDEGIQAIIGLSQRFIGALLSLCQLPNLYYTLLLRPRELTYQIDYGHDGSFNTGHPSFGLGLSLLQSLDVRSKLGLLIMNSMFLCISSLIILCAL